MPICSSMISTETFPSSGPPTPGAAFFTATKQKAEGMSLLRTSSKDSKACYAPTCSGDVNLTVRTLDKREHQLSVAHDISVRELKDAVAMITSIDAESQVSPDYTTLLSLPFIVLSSLFVRLALFS